MKYLVTFALAATMGSATSLASMGSEEVMQERRSVRAEFTYHENIEANSPSNVTDPDDQMEAKRRAFSDRKAK